MEIEAFVPEYSIVTNGTYKTVEYNVELCWSKHKWTVSATFDDISKLHNQLLNDCNGLPELPHRSILGQFLNDDAEALRSAINSYIIVT